MNQSLLDRAKKAGVILVFHSYMWEHGDKLASYGEKRLPDDACLPHRHRHGHSRRRAFRFPDLRRRSAAADSGHGHAQESERRGIGGNQRVSVDEAIKVWTLDGAYATFEEKIKGSITPGKLADFVVLQKDPRKVPPDTIKDIVVEATYLGGQKVYSAPAKTVAMIPQPPLNYGDGDYGDGDEAENESLFGN